MKRKILYSCLSLVLIFTLTFFAVPVQTSSPEETEGGCFSLAAGRRVTNDGSVLFGHNEDDGGTLVTRLHLVPRIHHEPGEVIEMWDIVLPDGTKATIPQVVGETWAYIWSELPGLRSADAFLNEWGVAIASNACSSKEASSYDLTNGGIWYWVRRLVAERAKTAREGVQIVGEMVEQLGYASSGRTYTIADPKETWLCSLVAGRHWVAQRVPDGEVAVIANRYSIRHVDLTDTHNFLGAPDLISYAISKGWYDPASGEPFDFGKAYGSPTSQTGQYNTLRQWMGLKLLTGKDYPLDDLPFSVKPKNRKLTVRDIIGILRNHYEGTEYDQTVNGDPHHTSTRVICTASTQESFVMQLRSNSPIGDLHHWRTHDRPCGGIYAPLGNVYWRTQGRPCEGVYVPIYSGILEIPTPYAIGEPELYNELPLDTRYYDPDSAYWVFNKLDTLVDMDYLARKPLVRSVWDNFEATEFALQDEIEKTAHKIYEEGNYHGTPGVDEYLARWFLTRYSESVALDAYYKGLGFIKEFEP